MGKNRLEAFSDGVIAIIITIMVLELKVPHDASFNALLPLWPVFMSYVLSFIYIGIYWNNHHHMMHVVDQVSGGVLWANLHLLFWLSLIPFVTAWMGENHFGTGPTVAYGFVLFMCATAYSLLVRTHRSPPAGEGMQVASTYDFEDRSATATPAKVKPIATSSFAPSASPRLRAAASTPTTGVDRVAIDASAGGRRRRAANQVT